MYKYISEILNRIVIGYVFIESGFGKLQNLEKVISYFDSLHIPFAAFQAPMVSLFELIFGLFIIIGFFTRSSALPLIAIMTVAIATAKAEDITSFSSLLGISEFLYIILLMNLVTYGSNYLSIDAYLKNRKSKLAK